MSLSDQIKQLRLEQNLTQEQLATKLGVSAQAVSKWETSETYPDGALLVPLATALGTSLDTLFGNTAYSMKDLSTRIRHLIAATPSSDQFSLVRDICWQIEKGLFNCRMQIEDSYRPSEITEQTNASYILNEFGFTHISNGRAPFFAVFPDSQGNLSEVIGDGEEMRQIFHALSSPPSMKAVLFVLRQEEGYLFEADVLARECEISPDRIDAVLGDLSTLRLVAPMDLEINGCPRRLYRTRPNHRIIPLFLFAHELNYRGAYCLQSHNRSRPFLT